MNAERNMLANLTVQGTAMSETALCTDCSNVDRMLAAEAAAEAAGDWDGLHNRDCTGNTELTCQVCGWNGGPEEADVNVEMTLKVYMTWDSEAHRWSVARPSLDGHALDQVEEGLYFSNDQGYADQDWATQNKFDEALESMEINAHNLLGMLNDAFDYRVNPETRQRYNLT